MTDREKLIQIIDSSRTYVAGKESLADHLLANGVRLEPKQATSDENKRWIPVSERLPEKRKFVLVFSTSKIVGEAIFDRDGMFYWAGSTEYDNDIEVTHWMPLPEPPKE